MSNRPSSKEFLIELFEKQKKEGKTEMVFPVFDEFTKSFSMITVKSVEDIEAYFKRIDDRK